MMQNGTEASALSRPHVPGFDVLACLHRGRRSVLWRAVSTGAGLPVTLKLASSDVASAEASRRLRREYDIGRRIECSHVVRYLDLVDCPTGPVIVLEFVDARSLAERETGPSEVAAVLQAAAQMVEGVQAIHAGGFVHGDLNACNVLASADLGRIKVADFGRAFVPGRGRHGRSSASVLSASSVPYMAPERMGASQRPADQRSDLYSLGAILYELLTGRPVFEEADMGALLHAHAARIPVPPTDVCKDVPPMVSRVVLRLLAKNPEDRYQGAAGLAWDLEQLSDRWDRDRRIVGFELGSRDVPAELAIPHRLYGRENEGMQLQDAFRRAIRGETGLVVLRGTPGVGTTSLAESLEPHVVGLGGRYVLVDAEPSEARVPFAVMRRVLRLLCRRTLSLPEEPVLEWGHRLTDALGPNAALVAGLIPESSHLLPERLEGEAEPEAGVLGARLRTALASMLRALAPSSSPLCVVLGNLSWVDASSLDVITDALSAHPPLLVVVTRNGGEGDAGGEPVRQLLELQEGVGSVVIDVPPLSEDAVEALLRDSLGAQGIDIDGLLARVADRSGGRPALLCAFLRAAKRARALWYDTHRGQWCWDETALDDMPFPGSVGDVVASRLSELSRADLRVLRGMACLGLEADSALLATALQLEPETVDAAMARASSLGLVHRAAAEPAAGSTVDSARERYRFTQPRVQQRAYEGLDPEDGRLLHAALATALVEDFAAGSRGPEATVAAAEQCCLCGPAELREDERMRRVRIHMAAAAHFRRSAAFERCHTHALAARQLLGISPWGDCPELALETALLAAEAASLIGRYDGALKQAAEVRAASTQTEALERADITEVRARIGQSDLQGAVELGLDALGRRGVILPEHPGRGRVLLAVLGVELALARRGVSSLESLPVAEDPQARFVMKMLWHLGAPTYFTDRNLLALSVTRLITMMLRHGRTPECPAFLAAYAMLMAGVFGRIGRALDLGRMALEGAGDRVDEWPRTCFMVMHFVQHWERPLADAVEPLRRAHAMALQGGDLEYAAYAAFSAGSHVLWGGALLADADEELTRQADAIRRTRHAHAGEWTAMERQFVHQMRLADTADELGGRYYEAGGDISEGDRTTVFLSHFIQAVLYAVRERYAAATDSAAVAWTHADGATSTFYLPILAFTHALSLLAEVAPGQPKGTTAAAVAAARRQLRRLRRWRRHCEATQAHRCRLIEAELARVAGRRARAAQAYEDAEAAAATQGLWMEAALCAQRAARFHQARSSVLMAQTYWHRCWEHHRRWGNVERTTWLERTFPTIGVTRTGTSKGWLAEDVAATATDVSALDLKALFGAAVAISEHLEIDALAQRIMQIAVIYTGASHAAVVLTDGEPWRLAGTYDSSSPGETTVPSDPEAALPPSVARYVLRTGDVVVAGRGDQEELFPGDPYLERRPPAALLCMAMEREGIPLGILYLENRDVSEVFTPRRVDVARLLAGQAAVALQNAALLADARALTDDLQREIAQRERAEEERRQYEQQARQQQKLESIGTLAGGVAHEINNPISGIMGYAQLIKDRLDPEHSLQPFADEIIGETQRVAGIVRNLLTFARRDKQTAPRPTDVAEVVRASTALIQTVMKGDQIDLRVMIPEGGPDVLCRSQQIQQVLMNLMTNGRDALNERYEAYDPGKIMRVSVQHLRESEAEWVRITVEDRGTGLSPEVRQQMFDPFYTTKEPGIGTGLGLAISYGIVEEHGGRLDVDSEKGAFTRIHVDLPVVVG